MSLVLNTNINSMVAQNSLTSSGTQLVQRPAAAVLGLAHQHRRRRRGRITRSPRA